MNPEYIGISLSVGYVVLMLVISHLAPKSPEQIAREKEKERLRAKILSYDDGTQAKEDVIKDLRELDKEDIADRHPFLIGGLIGVGIILMWVIGNMNSAESTDLANPSTRGGPGDESCRYKVESHISGAGGVTTGIEYKGKGVFVALVANETTGFKYRAVTFYTDSECNVVNVRVK